MKCPKGVKKGLLMCPKRSPVDLPLLKSDKMCNKCNGGKDKQAKRAPLYTDREKQAFRKDMENKDPYLKAQRIKVEKMIDKLNPEKKGKKMNKKKDNTMFLSTKKPGKTYSIVIRVEDNDAKIDTKDESNIIGSSGCGPLNKEAANEIFEIIKKQMEELFWEKSIKANIKKLPFKKGDEVEIQEDNRIHPEIHLLDEVSGELGFWDSGVWSPLKGIEGTIKRAK